MNPDKPLSLMDELAQVGFGRAKNDSFSQEDFTANISKNPAMRLNFSDMEEITSFNERNFQSSTPLVVPNSAPVESDDVTVDNHILKGYTQLMQTSSMFPRNIKPVSQSDTSELSYQGVTLNLEQELEQAKSQNSSADNECSLKDDHDVSKNVVPYNNVGDKSETTVCNNECTQTPDHSKVLALPNSNVGLSLKQEVEQTVSETDNACLTNNESPLKSYLNSSKNDTDIPETIKDTKAGTKDLLEPENKMETSMSRETLCLKQEPEVMENLSYSDKEEIVENSSEVLNVSDPKCISSECSEETDKHVIKNNCTPSNNNNNGDEFEVLNTLDYLGFDKEKLNSLSVSMTSNTSANSIDQKESDEHVNDLSAESRDVSVGVGKKRNLKLDSSLSPMTDVSPQKRNKIDSEMNPSSSVFEVKTLEIGLKQNKLLKDDLLNFDVCKTDLDNERSDNVHLKIKVELLEKELKNQQQLTTQAAQMGLQVVNENHDLKEKVEDLLTTIAKAEEEIKNERHTVNLKLKNKDYMEHQYNEEISDLKDEIVKVQESLDTTKKSKTVLSQQLRSMEYSAEHSQLKIQQLTTTIEHLQKMLNEKVDQSISAPTKQNDDDTVEQITALQQEILDLQNNNTILKSQLISHEANIKRLEDELHFCQQCKRNNEQEIDEMKSEINSYYKAVESSKIDIKDLKAQLHAAELQNMNPKDRGNSLFSEIEDRRVLAEKMVVTLQRNYETLKKNFNVEKQQHHKLKIQAVSLLQMNADKVSEDYALQLTSMLQDARSELKELQEKVNNYKRNEAQQANKLVKIQETFGTNENRDLIEFLHSLNDIKQKELDELKVKLSNVEMQYFQESAKVVDNIKKLRLTEEEIKSLRCNNMKLKLRIEELLMKFNPDELLEKSSPKKRVEKLAFGPIENLTQSLMKEETKPRKKTSPEKQTKCKAQQIAELVYSGAINPIDLLTGSPKAKKKVVSMSSNVTVIDENGKEEKKMNHDVENIPTKLERRQRRPQGTFAPADKIIEVKSPVRKADCKQQ